MRNLANFATRQFFSNSAMHKYALGCSNKYAKYGMQDFEKRLKMTDQLFSVQSIAFIMYQKQ